MDEGILFAAVHPQGHQGEKCAAECLRSASRSVAQQARQLLRSLQKREANDKRSYSHQSFIYHMITGEDMTVYLVVTREQFPRLTAFECLYKIKQSHGIYKSDVPRLEDELKKLADRFSDPDQNKVRKLQREVEQVKETMTDNIDRMMDRGDKIEDIVYATENLAHEAQDFHTNARTLKRRMWLKKIMIIIAAVVIVLVLILVLLFVFCHKDGFNLSGCF